MIRVEATDLSGRHIGITATVDLDGQPMTGRIKSLEHGGPFFEGKVRITLDRGGSTMLARIPANAYVALDVELPTLTLERTTTAS